MINQRFMISHKITSATSLWHEELVSASAWEQLRFQHYHMSSVYQGSYQQHSCSDTRRPSWHPGKGPHFCSCHLEPAEACQGVTVHALMVEAAESVWGPLMACQGVTVRALMVEDAEGAQGLLMAVGPCWKAEAVGSPCWQAERCHTCSV